MTLSADVVRDLLPAYLAGEASEDTRSLVEAYLREHPDFAQEVREQAARVTSALALEVEPPLPDLEKQAFERARRFGRYRSQLLGFAIAYGLLPFACVVRQGEVQWWMLRDAPMAALMFVVAAGACAAAYVVLGRRLRER